MTSEWVSEWKSLSHVRFFATPWTIQLWNSLGQNTGVGSLSLLQGIFLTQESNQGLLHCRKILYQLSYWGSPLTSSECISSVWILPFKEWCSTKLHKNLLSWLHLFPAPALHFSRFNCNYGLGGLCYQLIAWSQIHYREKFTLWFVSTFCFSSPNGSRLGKEPQCWLLEYK